MSHSCETYTSIDGNRTAQAILVVLEPTFITTLYAFRIAFDITMVNEHAVDKEFQNLHGVDFWAQRF
jgi:hypothetical protein